MKTRLGRGYGSTAGLLAKGSTGTDTHSEDFLRVGDGLDVGIPGKCGAHSLFRRSNSNKGSVWEDDSHDLNEDSNNKEGWMTLSK
jgi:hypothetical protein